MKANVGPLDRALRLSAGAVLLILAATEVIGPWGWLGIIPILTGTSGICPAYLPFGFSTCKSAKQSEEPTS